MAAALQAAQLRCSGPSAFGRRNVVARASQRGLIVSASAQAPPQPQPLALHIAETTLSFPLRAAEVRRLSEALTGVMQTFAEKQAAERPKRWPAMEYVFKGDPAAREVEHLEVFVNPNAHVTAFDARALITLRTADGLKVTTEGKLTALKADVDECLGQLA